MPSPTEVFGGKEVPFGTGKIDLDHFFESPSADAISSVTQGTWEKVFDTCGDVLGWGGILTWAQRFAKNAWLKGPEERAWIDDWIKGLIAGGASSAFITSLLGILGAPALLSGAAAAGVAGGFSYYSSAKTNRQLLSGKESKNILEGMDYGNGTYWHNSHLGFPPQIETKASPNQSTNAAERKKQMDGIIMDIDILSNFEERKENQENLNPDSVEKAAAQRLAQIPGSGVVITDNEGNFSATALDFLYFDPEADSVPLLRSLFRNTIERILHGKVQMEKEAKKHFQETATGEEKRSLILRNLNRRWSRTKTGTKDANRKKKSKADRVRDIFRGAEVAFGATIGADYFNPVHPRFWEKDDAIRDAVVQDFKTELNECVLNNNPNWETDSAIVKKIFSKEDLLFQLFSFQKIKGILRSSQSFSRFEKKNPDSYQAFLDMSQTNRDLFLDEFKVSSPQEIGEAIRGSTPFPSLPEAIRNDFITKVQEASQREKLTQIIRKANPNSATDFPEAKRGNREFTKIYKHRKKTFAEFHAEGQEKGSGIIEIIKNYIGHRAKNAILPAGWEAAFETAWGFFQSRRRNS